VVVGAVEHIMQVSQEPANAAVQVEVLVVLWAPIMSLAVECRDKVILVVLQAPTQVVAVAAQVHLVMAVLAVLALADLAVQDVLFQYRVRL
jgi:hypothetical protein